MKNSLGIPLYLGFLEQFSIFDCAIYFETGPGYVAHTGSNWCFSCLTLLRANDNHVPQCLVVKFRGCALPVAEG